MSKVCLSFALCLGQFISIVFCHFHYQGISLPCLNFVFKYLFLFVTSINQMAFSIFLFLQQGHISYVEMKLISVNLCLVASFIFLISYILLEYFKFYMFKIMSFPNKDNLTSFFPIWCLFFMFPTKSFLFLLESLLISLDLELFFCILVACS